MSDIPDAWEREAWVAVTVTGGAQVAAWRPRPWLPGYLFGSHFFIVDGCGYLFREGFWEIFGFFFVNLILERECMNEENKSWSMIMSEEVLGLI